MQERGIIIASGGSAVGLSMFASFVGLCCIGPWTVALLGVSGAVSMARWQPFRPYILSVAGSMLAWAFWRTYRLKRVCLAEGCTDERPGAAMYFSVWLSALLLVLAVFAEQAANPGSVDSHPPADGAYASEVPEHRYILAD
jgi:MerT mercuric transport protein